MGHVDFLPKISTTLDQIDITKLRKIQG